MKDLNAGVTVAAGARIGAFPGRDADPDPGVLIARMSEILRASELESAWAAIVATLRGIGFRHVVYGYSPDSRGAVLGAVEDILVLSTLAPADIAELVGSGHHLASVTFNHALRHQGVFSWSMTAGPPPPEPLSQAALDFYERVEMHAGCTIGFSAHRTRGLAVMALAAPPGVGQPELDVWLRAADSALFVLASVAHRALSGLPWPRPTGSLTPRQREVLEWVAEGKTTADIACILGLTPATVEKHLRLARQCLGVETTAHALIKAAFLNQVFVRSPRERGRPYARH